jgi:general secretion pathway protein B
MSYILDALRRADSERERGAVPGVHAQPVPLGSGDAARPSAPHTWLWVSVGLASVLAALLAWQLWGRSNTAPEGAAPPSAAVVTLPDAAAAAPTTAAAVVMAPEPAPAPVAEPASTPAAPLRAPITAVATRPRPTPPTKAVAAVGPRTAASASTAPVPTANELPDDIQRGLPALVVGGASYSQNAENRMLIVNGQVFREGDKLAPDVSLEQIRLKEAVLVTKGHRYRIVY